MTVCGLGNRKNVLFNEILDAEGIEPYPGSVAVLDDLERRGTPVAVVTSSRNGPHVLRTAGLAERFEVLVDGSVATEQGSPASRSRTPSVMQPSCSASSRPGAWWSRTPSPGSPPALAAASGSSSASTGGVGADTLRQAGADVVVNDLAELLSHP